MVLYIYEKKKCCVHSFSTLFDNQRSVFTKVLEGAIVMDQLQPLPVGGSPQVRAMHRCTEWTMQVVHRGDDRLLAR